MRGPFPSTAASHYSLPAAQGAPAGQAAADWCWVWADRMPVGEELTGGLADNRLRSAEVYWMVQNRLTPAIPAFPNCRS